MAGEDFTGLPVLKVQSRVSLESRLPEAVPTKAGLPRNMGQSERGLVEVPDEAADGAAAAAHPSQQSRGATQRVLPPHICTQTYLVASILATQIIPTRIILTMG